MKNERRVSDDKKPGTSKDCVMLWNTKNKNIRFIKYTKYTP